MAIGVAVSDTCARSVADWHCGVQVSDTVGTTKTKIPAVFPRGGKN